ALFLGALGVLAVPIGLSGATLPLIFHQLRREVGDLGAAAGRLYAWNTVGSLVGALFGGYLLFYWLDLDQVYRVAPAAVVRAATLVSVRVLELPRPATVVLVALPLAIAIAKLPRWDVNRLASGAFRLRQPIPGLSYAGADRFFAGIRRGTHVVFYKDDPNSSVSVLELSDAAGGGGTAIPTNAQARGSGRVGHPPPALAARPPPALTPTPEP